MNRTILSIVIPVFNNPSLLEQMVNSILDNTFQDWELLLIDDGSDDETIRLLEKMESFDSRIKIFSRTVLPKGAQKCRNIGIEKANGEYLCIMDSDDIVAPYCFQQRVSFMESHPELDFACFPAQTFIGNDISNKVNKFYGIKSLNKKPLDPFFWGLLPMVGWTNCYKLESIKKNALYWDERILSRQDSDYNIQSIIKGLRFDFAPAKIDYYWRVLPKSESITTKIHTSDHLESHMYMLKKINDSVKDRTYLYNRNAVCCYLLDYATIFIQGRTNAIPIGFFSLPWFEEMPFFLMKIRLYISLAQFSKNASYLKLLRWCLFPSIIAQGLFYSKQKDKKCLSFINNQLED